jgi:AcrR family transcriptional regulator
MTRPYRSDLRDDQAAATRERILDAAHRLLGTTRPVDLAYADVAREANVSVRTLYRHFPAPEDLFLALSDRLLTEILGAEKQMPTDVPSALQVMRRQFELLERDPALYRVFFAVPTRSRHGGPGPLFEAIFGERLAAVPEAQRRQVWALLDLLGSPYAWDVLHANWGADGERAYRAAMFGMRAVLELAEREPALLDCPEPFLPEPKR